MQAYRMLWTRLSSLGAGRAEALANNRSTLWTAGSFLQPVRCAAAQAQPPPYQKRPLYHNQTMKMLRKEAEDRGLSPNGKKIVLVERLRQADERVKQDAARAAQTEAVAPARLSEPAPSPAPAPAPAPAEAKAPTPPPAPAPAPALEATPAPPLASPSAPAPAPASADMQAAAAALAGDPPHQGSAAHGQPLPGISRTNGTGAARARANSEPQESESIALQRSKPTKATPGRPKPKPVHPSDYFRERPARPPASEPVEAAAAAPPAPQSATDSQQQSRQRPRRNKHFENLLPEPDAATEATGLAVTWLGTSSGAPTNRRNVSAIALRTPDHTCLVDCGEGTLRQMQAGRMDPARVTHICISHMHGDHCFGLPGMIHNVSEARAARGNTTEPLLIFGAPGLHLLLESALGFAPKPLSMPVTAYEFAVQPQRSFRPKPMDGLGGTVHFGCLAPDRTPAAARALKQLSEFSSNRTDMHAMHEVPVVPGLVWSVPGPSALRITAAQLQHRVPCWGYVFQEEGTPEAEGRKVVLLGDTAGSRAILEPGMGADLLSHEATFSMDMAGKARISQHSTARDAGRFAAALQAKTLVLTHFSNRYSFEGNRPLGGQHLDATSGDITMLCREALSAYRNRNIVAASDLYTFKVPHRRPADADRPLREHAALTSASAR